MRKSIKDLDVYWNKLFRTMTEGRQSDIEVLNRTEIFEFYAKLEDYEKGVEEKNKQLEKKRRKKKAKK